ncbi:MAG: YdiY family protein [Paracoccaceae bacterium]
MTVKLRTLGAGVLAIAAAQVAFAPAAVAQVAITGVESVNDQIDDINDDVAKDMRRAEDAARFGNPDFRPGLSGSASLGYSGKTGNNESQDLTAGVRLRYAQGQFVQTLGAALDFAESNNVSTKEDVFVVYDANYYFDQNFYAFALARLKTDGLATEWDGVNPAMDPRAGNTRRDAFLGFGPGYRIVNTPDMTWRVQAGVGVSYLQNGLKESTTETGYLAASRFFYKINDNFFVTNDTDVLKSKSALRANNDLGLNVKMTDAFSTRVSYLTEYDESRAIRTDNKLGVSLVFGF